MQKLRFIQIERGNKEHFEFAKRLWLPFIWEINEHEGVNETEEEILYDLTRRINIQGSRADMHFEIVFADENPVGISMFAIDTGTVYDLLESGYGTIMGFYMAPEYRRKGYGREFFQHIETVLKKDGAPKIYLAPDGVTGEPFWISLGFKNSGKFDPDDKKYIYIKDCAVNKQTCGKITFETVNSENSTDFRRLMKMYVEELDQHSDEKTPDDFLEKWIDSIIAIQGDSDRHLEYCYLGETLIGFLYGKVDREEHKGFKKVGYGYIMEFYVLPKYRRKGLGRQMARHLELLFERDGAKRMYLTSDPVTGKPFWEAMGFINTYEKSPENNQEIYEKAIVNEAVTVYVSDYLTHELADKIAQALWQGPDWAGHILRQLEEYRAQTDCFNVIAQNEQGEVVGRLFCLQNRDNKKLWYYGDLFVTSEYHRRHIADRMLAAAEQTLSERGCCVLRCYVEPENTPSLLMQTKNGFKEKPYERFNDLENEGQFMFEKELSVQNADV